jgi:hypothetical protein
VSAARPAAHSAAHPTAHLAAHSAYSSLHFCHIGSTTRSRTATSTSPLSRP